MVKNTKKRSKKTKKTKNDGYPKRSKKLMRYHGREGHPLLHKDKETGRIYFMVRTEKGMERLYLVKGNVPKALREHPSEKRLKAKNPNKIPRKTKPKTPKKKRRIKKKEGVGALGALVILGGAYFLYQAYKRTSGQFAKVTGEQPQKAEKRILSYREWREQRRKQRGL